MDKVLILGSTGKLGRALVRAFSVDFQVHARHAADGFDAGDFPQVLRTLEELRPDLVINAVALNGLNPCERDPALAFHLNTLLPKVLAQASGPLGFGLVHFSSDAVFDGRRRWGAYLETDAPAPINVYGHTKFGGDCFVRTEAERHHVFRLSLLAGDAGAASQQFLEKTIARARAGEALRIADDIVCSPSSAGDVALAVKAAVQAQLPFGLYHLANAGQASLHQLVQEVLGLLRLQVPVEPVLHTEFPSPARKNQYTPLASGRIPPLRDWREAIRDYCRDLERP